MLMIAKSDEHQIPLRLNLYILLTIVSPSHSGGSVTIFKRNRRRTQAFALQLLGPIGAFTCTGR
jgi:hypothetical protein